MAQSGVKVDDQIKALFQQIKVPGKNKQKFKYFVMKMDDKFEKVVIEKIAEVSPDGYDANFAEFQELMKEVEASKQCRYVVYDYFFKNKDGTENSKLLLIYWGPNTANVKSKMLYSSTFSTLRKQLEEGTTVIEAHDVDEISEESLEEKLKQK